MKNRVQMVPVAALVVLSTSALAETTTTVVDFNSGFQGWEGPTLNGAESYIKPEGGRGDNGRYLYTSSNSFGTGIFNYTNQSFLGDYTQSESITVSIDLQVQELQALGNPLERPFGVEFFNTQLSNLPVFPYSSVFLEFDQVSQAENSDWITYSVTFDPSSLALPSSWIGTGAEDDFGSPTLPDDVSFSDIFSNVDGIGFHTFKPGVIYSAGTEHVFGYDNITITRAVPAPAALKLFGLGGLLVVGRRRR